MYHRREGKITTTINIQLKDEQETGKLKTTEASNHIKST